MCASIVSSRVGNRRIPESASCDDIRPGRCHRAGDRVWPGLRDRPWRSGPSLVDAPRSNRPCHVATAFERRERYRGARASTGPCNQARPASTTRSSRPASGSQVGAILALHSSWRFPTRAKVSPPWVLPGIGWDLPFGFTSHLEIRGDAERIKAARHRRLQLLTSSRPENVQFEVGVVFATGARPRANQAVQRAVYPGPFAHRGDGGTNRRPTMWGKPNESHRAPQT